MKSIAPPPTSLRQPATYGDRAIRGKLRIWKNGLARQYRYIDRATKNPGLRVISRDMTLRNSMVGRRRAFDKLRKLLGNALTLELLHLKGNYPLALWTVLKPRVSVTDDPARSQDCVTVNYLIAGTLPLSIGQLGFGFDDGLWSLEVPDHALGRLLERSPQSDLSAVLLDAHHKVLQLSSITPMGPREEGELPKFLLPAGPGALVCSFTVVPDISNDNELSVHVYAHTWLANEMLYDNQVKSVDIGKLGQRLIDKQLLPVPLRRNLADPNADLLYKTWVAALMFNELSNLQGRA
jgi:hypothetical protein